jgi:uracil-DNA glycosylase
MELTLSSQQKLDMIASQVAACTKCQELTSYRTQTVFGVGNPDATVMFLGEAPGETEDRDGIPFVGRAGQLLTNIIKALGWTREQVYIVNICKCRPPRNRTPYKVEADNCRPFLDLQIKVVNPSYIVAMGNVAAQNLLGIERPISSLRGEIHEYNGRKVICTYHPSYLLRNPAAKRDVWDDLQVLVELMKGAVANGQSPVAD